MLLEVPIPDYGSIALPAPFWLIHLLLVATFILHIIPMNLVLGGSVTAAIASTLGMRSAKSYWARLAISLANILPYAVAVAITFGVAPLLFIQVAYGQFVFTSSILIAVAWLMVIPLLVLAYYGIYWFSIKFRVDMRDPLTLLIIWASAICFLIIAFIFVNNMTLMLTPKRWFAMYLENPYGLHLNLGEPTLLPRFIHIFIGSLAITSILIMYIGVYERSSDASYGRWLLRRGALWFTLATLAELIVGFWFLSSLPNGIRMMFLGGDIASTYELLAGIVMAVLAIFAFNFSAYSQKPKPALIFGSLLGFSIITVMVVMRDSVRTSYLAQYFNPAEQPSNPQWDVIAIFALLLIIAIAVVVWMLVRAARAVGKLPTQA